MKRTITSLLFIMLLFSSLTSCDNSKTGSNSTISSGGTGKLVLNFPVLKTKSLLPPISMEPVSYDINGTGPGSATFSVTSNQSIVEISDLDFGDWTVIVDAKNSDETIIGWGQATTTVHVGETSVVNITIVPLDGTGTIDLTVNWTAADTEYPTIESQLIPTTGEPIDLDFTITNGNQGTCVNNTIPTGYYTLIVKLLDGDPVNTTPILTMGSVEAVRIVKDETTTGIFDFFQINQPGGCIEVNIDTQMNDPIAVSLSGQQAELAENRYMTITASVPVEVSNAIYVWYINGESQATGDSFTVSGLPMGVYRLDVTAFTANGMKAGSAGCDFNVTEAIIYAIGDTGPAGGLIFYDKGTYSDGWQYLEAAPVDQNYNGDYYVEWGCSGTNIPGADSTEIGTGYQNTIEIDAACTTPGIAADICVNYSINGYDDWFLPSIDELSLMYNNLDLHGNNIGGFTDDCYWSSTESPHYNWAWLVFFANGVVYDEYMRSYPNKVRAVRRF